MDEHSENLKKEIENIKKNESKLNNVINEIKKYTRGRQQQIG